MIAPLCYLPKSRAQKDSVGKSISIGMEATISTVSQMSVWPKRKAYDQY